MCGLYFKRDEQDMDTLNRMAYEYHDDEGEHDANRRCRNNERRCVDGRGVQRRRWGCEGRARDRVRNEE